MFVTCFALLLSGPGPANSIPMETSQPEIARRRTFAIISHPDAGKTTLTEKLLLFGGAIQLAGEVKARGERRRVRSDWMEVERERGISVSSAVMTFEHGGLTFNLLDTPGHQDFSEDTYRTLTAVDSAVMVLDAARGIEAQTLKLFEVCRLRDVPIITFINKLDREAREPFDLLDEIERTLALDATPASWPIGMGRDFLGTYDLFEDALLLFERGAGERVTEPVRCQGLDDPKLAGLLPAHALAKLREDIEMARGLCKPFDLKSYREGHLTPAYFGSALNNFGVRELLRGIAELALSPNAETNAPREALADCVEESERVLAILNTLMDITEAETGIMKLERKRVDLCQLVREVAEVYQYVAEERQVTVNLELPAPCEAEVDRNRIRQAFANLLDNAIKYTPAGGQVRIMVQNERAWAVAVFRDTGIGIPEEKLGVIFEAFRQAEAEHF